METKENHFSSKELTDFIRDANRYRWLRKQHWTTSTLAVVMEPKNSVKLGRILPSEEHLDKLIDEQMKKK